MQFRQQALSKLQSPEELDLPVRFARPQGWLVLPVTRRRSWPRASVWAVTGTVSSTLERARHPHPRAGQLRPAEPGRRPGHRTCSRRRASRLPAERSRAEGPYASGGDRAVRTVAAGRVTALAATIGSVVTTGADVATVERVAQRRRSPGGDAVRAGASSGATVRRAPPST